MNPQRATPRLIQSLIDRIHQSLSIRRRMHVMGVMHTTLAIAKSRGLNLGDAAVAALLHDICKEINPKVIGAELADLGVEIPADDRGFSRVWHGLHAAVVAERQYGIDEPAILEALTLHTTSDAGVGPLTKALFVADLCEPGRTIAEGPKILALAMKDLDAGYREALTAKTRHVLEKRGALSARALRALRECCDGDASRAARDSEKVLRQAEAAAGVN